MTETLGCLARAQRASTSASRIVAVGAGADAAQVVDDHRGIREPPAHPVDFGEAVGVDQAGEGLAGLCGGGEHGCITGGLEPARGRLLAVAGLNAEGARRRAWRSSRMALPGSAASGSTIAVPTKRSGYSLIMSSM